ncbi:MAG: DEAD/DEAH box helicase [Candidatus Thermoplasmatota archaeon]
MMISKEFIKPNTVEHRDYQVNIALTASKANTLVVLPTGLGKTTIALLLIAEHLKNNNNKILFLAPTKPLVLQHTQYLKEYLTIKHEDIIMFTGDISPSKRKEHYQKGRIIISTPQVIENDLLSHHLTLKDYSLIIFDEVHRAVGNYSYVYIAETYQKERANHLILGITASPGNDEKKILEICKHLNIKNIEIRTPYDRDVKPYVHSLNIQWREIPLPPEFNHIIQLLRKALSTRLTLLKDYGLIESPSVSLINRTKLLEAQQIIQSTLKEEAKPSKDIFIAASVQNAALKIYHAIELLQTQRVTVLLNYLKRIEEEAKSKEGSKASRDIIRDPLILESIAYAKSLKIEHPKIPEVVEIIKRQIQEKKDSKIIIFTNYRDTSQYIVKKLEETENIKPVRFVGQTVKNNDKGLTQKEQATIIEGFKKGVYNVLVATSVAEEGLDIPSTDLVVFYEPIPSEIRTIQRRGRTGRRMPGKVIILITKNTPDEAYYWSAKRKERRMHQELEYLRNKINKELHDHSSIYNTILLREEKVNQRRIDDYSNTEDKTNNKNTRIIVDSRESRSMVSKYLSYHNDLDIEYKQIQTGDYILSERIGVERKTVDDFLSSLTEGKLFMQMRKLKDAYSRPILILEGEGLTNKRNIKPQSIYGGLVSIIVDFGIPVIMSMDPKETAEILFTIAKREQRENKRPIAIRGDKTSMSTSENQRFIIEGLPNISAVLADRLLRHFGNIRSLANATIEDLCEIKGIGRTIASDIIKVLNEDYKEG